jgi:hypothetical protein
MWQDLSAQLHIHNLYNVAGALVGFSLQPLLVPGRCLCTRSTLVVNSLLNRQQELWQSELANTCNLPDAAITDKPRILVQTLLKSLIRKAMLDFFNFGWRSKKFSEPIHFKFTTMILPYCITAYPISFLQSSTLATNICGPNGIISMHLIWRVGQATNWSLRHTTPK